MFNPLSALESVLLQTNSHNTESHWVHWLMASTAALHPLHPLHCMTALSSSTALLHWVHQFHCIAVSPALHWVHPLHYCITMLSPLQCCSGGANAMMQQCSQWIVGAIHRLMRSVHWCTDADVGVVSNLVDRWRIGCSYLVMEMGRSIVI